MRDPPGLISTLEPPPRGVIFDYGNTLIPFGRREMDRIAGTLGAFFCREIPDTEPFRARKALLETWVVLHRQRAERDEESDPRDVIRMTYRTLGAEATEDAVAAGIATYVDAFVAAVGIGDGVHEVLGALRDRGFSLGLLSNYSLGDAIRLSLAKIGLVEYFDALVVSADLGLVKPHPELFLETARRLGPAPEEILFVGDNLRADIAGGAAVGMRTALVTEYQGGAYYFEDPDENLADVKPDLVLDRLGDLTRGS